MIDLHSIMNAGEYHIHIRNMDEFEELKEAWNSISCDVMWTETLTRYARNASLVILLDFEDKIMPCWYWSHISDVPDGTIIYTIDNIRSPIATDIGDIETEGIDLFALFGGDQTSV